MLKLVFMCPSCERYRNAEVSRAFVSANENPEVIGSCKKCNQNYVLEIDKTLWSRGDVPYSLGDYTEGY